MPRAQAFIPLAKGLDQKLDERLRDADALQQVTNGYFKRGNALSKRPGFSRIPASSPTTNPKAIVSSGDELLLRGPTQLYALTEPTTAVNAYSWLAKGDVSPFTGSQRPVFSDSTSCISYDSAAADGIVLHVAASIRYTDPSTLVAGYTQELRYRIEDEATQAEIVSTQTLLTTTGTSGAAGVKAVAAGTGANARITFGYTNPALGRLQFYQQVVATPAATPAVLITHNDLYVAALDNNFRRYDMTSLNVPNTATWSYAYVKTAVMGGPGDIFVATYNGSTLLGSWTIPPPLGTTWNWVAIADDVANNRILVAAIDATQQIRLYSQNRTSGVTTWTRLMHATPNPSTGISVGQGSLGATIYNVVVANSASAAGGGGTSGTYDITASYTDTGGVTLSGVQRTYNAQAKSKPFFVDGRCYFTALTRYGKTSPATDNYDVEYGSEVVYDLLGGSTTSPFYPSIVARYNFGVAATRSYTASPYDEFDLGLGSFSQVQRFVGDTSKWRTSTRRVINKVGFREYVQAGDELVFDFDGISTSATTTRGTVALGGGQVSWYSGGRVEDLGYASAPIYSATVAIGVDPGTATLDHGTYQYVAIFTAYDEKGNLIRSMPGPPISVVVPAGGGGPNPNHYIETRWFILGPTQRWDGENYYTLTLYRAGSDGVFRRCLQPLKEPFAIRNNNYFLTVRDNGEAYDVLYTQGGAELEATGPDGAAFVAVTSKRVWLSGFFRRDRIQYSKLYTPATANEFALAPEFNDAFSYLLPGGENVTGICEMDDKIIVFTRSNIYAIAGNGPDDGGRGNDYSGLQLVASDTGCIEPRSIVSSPIGVLFRGSSGIFALGRDLQLTFIGAAVRDATDLYSEITSAVLVPLHNHVRFTCRLDGAQSIVLIYDFDQTAWLEWQIKRFTIGGGTLLNIVGACLHKGTYYVVDANGDIFRENPGTYLDDNDNVYVPMTIQTGWLQIAQQSGWQRIRKVAALCKSLDPHALRIRISQDFDSSFSQSFTWTYSEIQNMRLNELVEMHIKQQKCTAFQVTIDDFEDGSSPAVTGQGYECAGFTVELSGKRGLYKPGTQQRN